MPASARSFCAVEASASTRAAALARRPMSRMVAAISPDPSMVFSGAAMAAEYMLNPVISRGSITSRGRSHPWPAPCLTWPLSSTVGAWTNVTTGQYSMILIDLSRDIEHKMAVLPNHPQVIVSPFATHDEVRVADGYGFSSATMALVLGDHAGTHVDAPKHFNADPQRHGDRPGAAGEFLHRGGVPRPVAQAAEIRHLDRGSAEGREGRRRHHQAEGHRAAAHGFLPPHQRHAGLHHRLSRPDQRIRRPGSARRASACSASRR